MSQEKSKDISRAVQIMGYHGPVLIHVPNEERFGLYKKCLESACHQLSLLLERHHNFFEPEVCFSLVECLAEKFDVILQEFPSLERLNTQNLTISLQQRTDNFVSSAVRCIERINHDRAIVCRLSFKDSAKNSAECRVCNLVSLDSDPHHGGEVVMLGEIRDNTNEIRKFVYKPSSIVIDMIMIGNIRGLFECNLSDIVRKNFNLERLPNSLVELLNERGGLTKAIGTYLVCPLIDESLARGLSQDPLTHYGYIEYLSHGSLLDNQSDDEVTHQAYSEHAGIISALATLWGVQDVHCQNVIVSRLLLYLIDMENALISTPPDVISTVLFNCTVGGFYGENSGNRIYRRDDSPVQIEPKSFEKGVRCVLKLFSYEDQVFLEEWINHPIMDSVIIRPVPVATKEFHQVSKALLTEWCMSEITQNELFEMFREIQSASYTQLGELHITAEEPETFTDENTPLLITLGERNCRVVFESCWAGDIPAYRMFVKSRNLWDPNYNILMVPSTEVPVNYFLHSPLQAMRNKIAILSMHEKYRKFIFHYLNLQIAFLNADRTDRDNLRLETNIFLDAAKIIYQLLDYDRVINVAHQDKELVYLADGLIELCIKASQINHVAKEDEMYKVVMRSLLARANQLLKSYKNDYEELSTGKRVRHVGAVREVYPLKRWVYGAEISENEAFSREKLLCQVVEMLYEQVQCATDLRNFIEKSDRCEGVDAVLLGVLKALIEFMRNKEDENQVLYAKQFILKHAEIDDVSNEALRASCEALFEYRAELRSRNTMRQSSDVSSVVNQPKGGK